MSGAWVPDEIQVGPFTYAVSIDRADAIAENAEAGRPVLGTTSARRQRIVIDPEQGDDSLVETLLHEVLHALWDAAGLCRGAMSFTQDDEERVVAALSPWLLDTMRRNPALVEALVGSDDEEDGDEETGPPDLRVV